MAARRYYEAEWATEANALALSIDRALAPLDGGATLPQADVVTAFLDNAIDLDTAATLLDLPSTSGTTLHPDHVQAILNSTGTATNKLQWRHSRGHKKHMRNGDIRSALATLLTADILALLS